jgi:hypothetical protein
MKAVCVKEILLITAAKLITIKTSALVQNAKSMKLDAWQVI